MYVYTYISSVIENRLRLLFLNTYENFSNVIGIYGIAIFYAILYAIFIQNKDPIMRWG